MSNYIFAGHRSFVAQSTSDFGVNALTVKGKPAAALVALANLCAQASTAPQANVAGILLKASVFRDQLLIAGHAADLMIKDVAFARAVPSPPTPMTHP